MAGYPVLYKLFIALFFLIFMLPFNALANKNFADSYNPSQSLYPIETLDLTFSDAQRQRELPLLLYVPVLPSSAAHGSAAPAPVVLFSHGLGGSRHVSAYLGEHWAARGYVAVFLQHPGSDDSIWRGKHLKNLPEIFAAAANGENFQLRVQDVKAVLDQLTVWQHSPDHPLFLRLDLERIGMSGHSFGAVTTQAVTGQVFGQKALFSDARLKAALIMSPSPPAQGDVDTAFGQVTLPWLLMTGTEDAAAFREVTPADRLLVYPALPPGDKYELLLDGARHLGFTDRPGRGRNPEHHPAILAISSAFWDCYLRGEANACRWLLDAKSILQPQDRWQYK